MTKELFIKYLQGKCTKEEFEKLLLWIRQESQTSYGQILVQEVWEEFEPEANSEGKLKYDRILDKIHHQININHNADRLKIQKGQANTRIITIITRAAAILLLPVLTLLLYTRFQEGNRYADNLNDLVVEAPAGSQMHFELGDGTKVWLNHGSKLKYPVRFKGKNRKVFLTGEAYFAVAHNKEVPFIVGTKWLDVKATGTAFNVNAYPGEKIVETTLIEGVVTLYESNSNREIKTLLPNQCLKLNTRENVYSIESDNSGKYIAWKDGRLVFKNDSIVKIAEKLARWYNVEVEITDEKVKEFTCTATFTDETLSQVLELMTLATPVKYKLSTREKLPDGSFSKQKVLIGLKK